MKNYWVTTGERRDAWVENLGQMVNLSNWLINSIEGIGFWVAKNNVLPGWNSGGVSIRGMTDTH